MRTFISIIPDDETRKRIFRLQSEVKQKASLINKRYPDSISWVTRDKFHITLFFIGEVNIEKLTKINEGLKDLEKDLLFGKFDFTAKGVNAFPKLKHPRVLVLDFVNEDNKVFKLSDRLNFNLAKSGIISDKAFHPHITLGRVRRNHRINLSELENLIIPELGFSVSKFHLMKSELKKGGSEYSVIAEYRL